MRLLPLTSYTLFIILTSLLLLILLLPSTAGLKCFKCLYDTKDSSPSELASPTSAASHCLKDKLPIRLLKQCDSPSRPQGVMVCTNSTLVENSKVVALSRGCGERVGGGGADGCVLDDDDGFLTCTCGGGVDGCNVAILDATYDDFVDPVKSGDGKGDKGHVHDHLERGGRPRHGDHHHGAHKTSGASPGQGTQGINHPFKLLSSFSMVFCILTMWGDWIRP